MQSLGSRIQSLGCRALMSRGRAVFYREVRVIEGFVPYYLHLTVQA